MRRFFIVLLLASLGATGHAAVKKDSLVPRTGKAKDLSLVRVNVTGQAYDYFRPWQKKAPFSKRGLGAVLSQGRVLVTADLVTNQNYVELERAESGEKNAATVQVIDYEANLALLLPTDKKFLDGLAPLELGQDVLVGDRVAAWQLEQTGALAVTEGLVTTVQMMHYPIDVGEFLAYRVSIAMQYRENSYTVPLVKNNKLAGLLLRYDPRSQLLDAIPAPIIAHFLKDAGSQHYQGFPSAGFSFFPTRDPQLRSFAGQTGKPGGVYVTSVEPNSPATKGGLQAGDIITTIANNEIDENGNYVDPRYGKLELTNLLTAHIFAGDTVPFKIQRAGKVMPLNITVRHRSPTDYVIPPYSLTEPPTYYVLGGLIFQELTRQYLKEWGANWQKEAPPRFVYIDRFQTELFPDANRRVVILSQVLPATGTIGYDDFSYLTVTKVNGKEIKSLADLATAVKEPVNGFIKIETEEDPKQLELEASQVAQEAPELQQSYGITQLQRLEPTPTPAPAPSPSPAADNAPR
jgi:S1-C subfamily serine protease